MKKSKRKLPEGFIKWRKHLGDVRKANPKLSLKQCMVKAKKSYKK